MNGKVLEFRGQDVSCTAPDELALKCALIEAVADFGLLAFAASLVASQELDLQKLAA